MKLLYLECAKIRQTTEHLVPSKLGRLEMKHLKSQSTRMKNKSGRWKRRKKGRKWAKKNIRGKRGAKKHCCCAKIR
jgi:hypothetical protein